ncbi:hypothetical protein [Streptomyces candidus]|uniref:Uncharacterized protein n=1 Tax=Streptomyces candidus TaxID=67283 RepID=A0A7X0HDT4_9ACTN|nr:hypothetical protein [Streptomyces candidus]MBB6434674.1 hypothetical protein [Streptomyces candidus]GHH35826.1 hypothetical protein GCM10018773_09790 [Streptomyces candidus]
MALLTVLLPVFMLGVVIALGRYEEVLLIPMTEAKDREPAPVRRALGS